MSYQNKNIILEEEKKIEPSSSGVWRVIGIFALIVFLGRNNTYDENHTDYSDSSYSNNETFYGYDCTSDCSGHEAGRDRADENGIVYKNDCGGYSESFIQGCRAFVDNN